MASFFQFTQGTESRVRPNDSSPLLGRFRAVPPRDAAHRHSQLGLLADRFTDGRGSVHVGYGALVAAGLADSDDEPTSSWPRQNEDVSMGRRLWRKWVVDLWVHPTPSAVKAVVDRWWSRYGLLVFLPAGLVC